jgi:urease accessory protein
MVSPVRYGNDITMKHALSIVPVGKWSDATAVDHVVLDATERHRRRMMLTGEHGTEFLLDLPHATCLRDGDGLLLEDGAIVRVDGKPEHLIEIAATSAPELARLAWHIGNRHTDVQVVSDRLRIRYDHVLDDMLRGLGATLTRLYAPFDPERGAYHGERGGHGHHT